MSALKELKKRLGNKPPVRCKSMIITIMGDVVFVHGGAIDTASVIALNALFDIGKHSSRIGISRLTAEDWLRQWRTGGRGGNRYQFSDKGLEAFRQSAPLIYGNRAPTWQDDWQLLFFNTDVHVKTVRRFIRAIGWMGYGKMLPTVYLCPTKATHEVNRLIAHYGLEKKVGLFQGAIPSDNNTLKRLAARLWDVKALRKEYAAFMRKFGGVKSILPKVIQDPPAAMYLRLRLIHEYRRLVLQSHLCQKIRNDFFAADTAFAFCGDLYRQLEKASGDFIATLGGDLAASPDDDSFARRFCQNDNDNTAFPPTFPPALKIYA